MLCRHIENAAERNNLLGFIISLIPFTRKLIPVLCLAKTLGAINRQPVPPAPEHPKSTLSTSFFAATTPNEAPSISSRNWARWMFFFRSLVYSVSNRGKWKINDRTRAGKRLVQRRPPIWPCRGWWTRLRLACFTAQSIGRPGMCFYRARHRSFSENVKWVVSHTEPKAANSGLHGRSWTNSLSKQALELGSRSPA